MGNNSSSSQPQVGAVDASESYDYDGWEIVESSKDQPGEFNISSAQISYLKSESYKSTVTKGRGNCPNYPEEKPPPYTAVSASKKCKLAEDDEFIPASERSAVEGDCSLDTCTLPDNMAVDLTIDHEKLGSGSYASVYLGDYKGKPCAVKKYHSSLLHHIETRKQKNYRASCFKDEIDILNGIHHPCVVQYFTHYEKWDENYRFQYIVMERLHGNLDDILAAGQTFNKQNTMSNIASALEYIHDRGIVHGDVNPTNILLSKDGASAKLADFGCAQYLGPSSKNFPGNPAFMPPQVSQNADKQEEVSHLSSKIDMFSFGLVLLIVHNGSFPQPDISGRMDGSEIIPETERRASLIISVRQKMPGLTELFNFAIHCIDSAPDARPDAKDYPNKSDRINLEPSFGSESCSVAQIKSMSTSVTPHPYNSEEPLQEQTTLNAINMDTHLHADQPSLQLYTDLPDSLLLTEKQQLLIKQQTIKTKLSIELADDPPYEGEEQMEEKHTQHHAIVTDPPTAPTLLDGKLELQLAKENKPTTEPPDSESEVQVDTQLCTNQPSLPDDLPSEGKGQVAEKDTHLCSNQPTVELTGQAAETHIQSPVTRELSGKSQPPKQPTEQKKVLAESDAIKAKDIGPRKRELPVSAKVVLAQQEQEDGAALPFKRVKLTSESDHESQSPLGPKGVTGQAADTHIQSPVTSESSNQPTEQKKVLAKSDAIKVKDIGPRKRERLVSAKVVSAQQKQKQAEEDEAALPFKRVKLTSESDHESQSPLGPKSVTGQAADTHIQSPVTSESSNQPTEQKKVLAKSDAIKVKDIGPRKRERLVSAKVVSAQQKQEQAEEDEAALPFKRVKLTSESDHESQSLLGPKGVTGQAADTHIQSPVTRESSDQPTEQKKVLAKPDAVKAKDIGPKKRELLISAKVYEDEAALPCKRVKLTSESDHKPLGLKSVTGQAADTHIQVTSVSSDQPTEQKKVLAKSDAKDIGPRKRELPVSAKVVSAQQKQEQAEEDEAALPFKPVKLTSESDHESQSLLGPKGVTGQVVETHIQSPVTSESSDQQKEVLDAKDIGPRQKELPVSEKVTSAQYKQEREDEAALSCKDVKFTSESDHESQSPLGPKGVTEQSAVTKEWPGKFPPPKQPKTQKKLGTRKRKRSSAKANQKKQPDCVLKPKALARSREAHGTSKALEPTVKKSHPPTKLAAKQGNNRTVRKPVEQTQMPTKQFRAVQKEEATNKPKPKTQYTKKSVTKVSTVTRCSRRKNPTMKSQIKSDVIPLKSPDNIASVDKQSISPNSDSSCFRAHRLATRKKNKKDKKAINRKSTDQSRALQNGEASSPLLGTEHNADASCGSKETVSMEKNYRARRRKEQRKKVCSKQPLKHPEEDYGLRVDLKTNTSRKNGNPRILCYNNGSKNSTPGKRDNGSSSQTRSNSSSKNTSSSSSSLSSNGNCGGASGCGGSGRDDDEGNKHNHRIISSEESSAEEESSDNEEASKDVDIDFPADIQVVLAYHNQDERMSSVYKSFGSLNPGYIAERPKQCKKKQVRKKHQQQKQAVTNTIVAKEIANKPSKGNHAPIPVTKTQSWQQTKRKKPSIVRGGGVALDSNDSDASNSSIEQLTEYEQPSSTVGDNFAAEYESDASEVKLKPCHGKATSPTLKTPQISVGSHDIAEISVPVQPTPFEVSSNPPHYIRPPEHSSSADRPSQQLESVEGSLSKAESVGEERPLFSAPMQEVDQSKSRSSSELVVYSHNHWRPPRCHEMNTAYPFHYIRPPSNHCNGPTLFMALLGPAENELAPSPGAVVLASDPSTGQSGPLMEATNCRPRQCFFNVHGREGNGVLLSQYIGDFVTLDDGAKELCQVMVDIIQFLRQKQHGLTTVESITIDVPRAVSIPESHLVPLNSHQTAITLKLLVRLVEEFLDLWERRYPGSSSVAISSLRWFVSWFHGVEESDQDVEAALLGDALLKLLRTH